MKITIYCMNSSLQIPGYYSVKQAAEELGCSTHEAWRLASSGTIKAMRLEGNQWYLDSLDVKRYQFISPKKGRPLSSKMAFALLWRLSGLQPDWVDRRSIKRIEDLLLRVDTAEEIVNLTRRRSRLLTFELYPSLRERLEKTLILSGSSEQSSRLLGIGGATTIEGYITSDGLALELSPLHLPEHQNGQLRVRVADWLPLAAPAMMPLAVIAADLAEATDARSSAAGLGKLEELLHD